ncbi:Probable trafficking protein particle complex subunit 2 [Strongyloides ratti]|uniref:Probable trafficking protein particle complex subunit 2 n=1 Tax=Strongyloides ratti TaxID=34506 RepID=A0A090LR66_STRRB|nr:Probable trafficking protein particle complex subunit 2 [Strongyloides ratti]CEF70662.1 Probable trafficking protein particle complex subunit 2 [Strongyloides ratti]
MSGTKEYYFAIVGHQDQPLFEMDFPVVDAHASLDVVDELIKTSPNMYLKCIDKFNEWNISVFVTASRIRFLILHTHKNDDGIKQFFHEMYETYIKYLMNPFYEINTAITSFAFENKALFFGRKYLS